MDGIEHPARLTVGVVGAGRVGAVLGAALARAGHQVTGVYAVSQESRARAADLLPGVPVLDVPSVVAGAELVVLAARGASVAHCPTSNAALGSGLFALRRHVDHGVRVALGSDVGAGTGFCLFKEGLQAYFVQQLQGERGLPLSAPDLLHLATRAGALSLGQGEEVGDLSVGKAFDAVWVRPRAGDPLEVGLRHAASAEDALAKTFAMACSADVVGVWVGGDRLKSA